MSLRRFLSIIAVFAFALVAILGAMQPSFAEDDDAEEPNFMSKVLGSVGLLALPGPQIDYQERPPLVVPPMTPYSQPNVPPPSATTSRQNPWDFNNPPAAETPDVQNQRPPQQAVILPQPVEPNSARVRNPDFPVDPEVKAAAKKKKSGNRIVSRALDDPVYSGRTLRADELNTRAAATKKSSGTNPNANDAQSTIQELGVPSIAKMLPMIGREQEKPVEFTGEPERQSLTQPPTGYLTPSKNAPYGVVSKEKQGRDETRLVHPNMPDYSGPTPTR